MAVIGRVFAIALGTVLAIALWVYAAEVVVKALDFNLQIIKWASAQLPKPYGPMVESALRVGLNADKALFVAECVWAVGAFMKLLKVVIFGPRRAAPPAAHGGGDHH